MKLHLHNMFEIPPAPNVAGGMVHCGQGLLVVVFLVIFGLASISCGKDPIFEQGDYIYENDDFTKVTISTASLSIGRTIWISAGNRRP